MLGSPLASDEWSEADRFLAHALEIDEVFSRCPCGQCGGYADITLTSDGAHEVKRIYCDARRALEQDKEDTKDETPEPGEIRIPVYVGG